MEKAKTKLIWSWALYDWANSAFATTIMAGFFPIFFKKYWSLGFSDTETTYTLGVMNSVASLFLALSSPAMGAIADEGSIRKHFLFVLTVLGAICSMALGFIAPGEWLWAALAFSLAMIAFTGAQTFYDALLVQIAPQSKLDQVSALGYAMGYLGGGVLFALNVFMVLKPELFFLKDKTQAIQFSFISVGLWWLVFSVPLFAFVPELKNPRESAWLKVVMNGFQSLWDHARRLKHERGLMIFLLGYFFYIDGVNTIIKMAVDYGLTIGLGEEDLMKALLLVQFVGFPAAVLFGFLGQKWGPSFGIWICLIGYIGVTIQAYALSTAAEFYFLAAVIGVIQGGIQSLSRSYYARLVPIKDSAQYFGFFNMVGKFSSILGPFLVGYVGLKTGSPRLGILVLLVFFVVGALLLFLSSQVKSNSSRAVG